MARKTRGGCGFRIDATFPFAASGLNRREIGTRQLQIADAIRQTFKDRGLCSLIEGECVGSSAHGEA